VSKHSEYRPCFSRMMTTFMGRVYQF